MIYPGVCRSSSVTVNKDSYLTCAKINRSNYNELLQHFPKLQEELKNHVLTYQDPLRLWLEMSLSQINYFKDLDRDIKQEFIYNMKVQQFEKESFIFRTDEKCDAMYLV